MGWWLTLNGDYVNSAALGALRAEGSDTTWHIRAVWATGNNADLLAGVWTSQGDAQEAIRLLIHGVDVSS